MLNFYFTPKHSFAPTKSAAVLFQVWGDLGVGGMDSEGNVIPRPPPTPVGRKSSGVAQSSSPASPAAATDTLSQTGSESPVQKVTELP